LQLEYNLLGLGNGRHYPNPVFWEEAAAVGNRVILGWDAHDPAWLTESDPARQAETFLDSLGMKRVETLTLVRPHPKA
jgi:histidinol-phosphatase (PHP family)